MSWQLLTTDIKQEIVELLDYESRCNLRSCSSFDRDVVDSTKIIAKNLKMTETSSEMAEGKTIVRLDIDSFTIWFIGRDNLTRIDRGWNGEIIEEFSEIIQKNRFEVIAEFMERFPQKGFIWVDTIDVDAINFPMPETWKIKCVNLKLFNIPQDHYLGWLRKFVALCQKYKKLEVGCWGNETEASELMSRITASESMKIDHDLDFSDEQLDAIEAVDIKILSTNMTAEGVRKRLEKFLKYGKKNDELDLHFPFVEPFNPQQQIIPSGLIIRKKKVENEQEGEYNGQIIGGFENVHGIQDPRDIHYVNFGELIRVYCKVYEKPTIHECIMYPF